MSFKTSINIIIIEINRIACVDFKWSGSHSKCNALTLF